LFFFFIWGATNNPTIAPITPPASNPLKKPLRTCFHPLIGKLAEFIMVTVSHQAAVLGNLIDVNLVFMLAVFNAAVPTIELVDTDPANRFAAACGTSH
jgi:hypothetical protein